jgi:hypothetical protein
MAFQDCETCTCPKCGGPCENRIVEDEECHEDVQHHCKTCRYSWWTDGGDS